MRRLLDPRALLAALAALALVGAYWLSVVLARDYYVEQSPDYSVYAQQPEGLKLYYRYLQELGVAPGVVQDFESLPRRGTIVAAAPFQKHPTRADGRRIARWVTGGGRLVLIGTEGRELLGGLDAGGQAQQASGRRRLRPLMPTAYARGVVAAEFGPQRVLADQPNWVTHFKDGSGQVLLSQKVGDGEVVWLSDPYPVTNAGIGRADDATLAVALAMASGGPVYFDEYHHGYVSRGGLWSRLGPGGRSAVVLVGAAVFAGMLSWSRRLGPPIPPVERPAARGGAYIDSLAELYRKAGARAEALEALEDGLVRALVRRHGSLGAGLALHPSADDAVRASKEARRREDLDRQAFLAAVERLRRARTEVEGADG